MGLFVSTGSHTHHSGEIHMIQASRQGAIAAAILALVGASQASAATVTVHGTDDLYNAGTAGTYDGTNPEAIDVTGLSSITFSVSGGNTVSVNGGGNFNDADGVGSVQGENDSGTASLSGIVAPTAGYMAGVFLGGTVAGVPSALDFTANGLGTGFASLAPMLQQTFFIGDGLTGDGTGATQTFYIPVGATTLYLGLTDACGYNGGPSCFDDNVGSFTVTTSAGGGTVGAVPEPTSLGLMLAGLGGLGLVTRRRNQKRARD
jgi:hypothetical protein